jgi:hypothetical protein
MDDFYKSERATHAWGAFQSQPEGAKRLLVDYVDRRIHQLRDELESCPVDKVLSIQASLTAMREIKSVLNTQRAPRTG